MNNEPLGRKYERLSREFEKQRHNTKEEATQLKKFFENPQYEPNPVEETRLHNRRLGEILDIMVGRTIKELS